MILRDYQTAAVDSVWYYFANGATGNPVIALPTGTGKSIVIGGLLQNIYTYYPQQRIMMLTHVKELIEQNFDKLIRMWPASPAGIYSAGVGRKDTHCKITFGGIQSVVKKAEVFGHIDMIFIDECHLVSPTQTTSYRKFIKELKKVNPYLKVVGLTATPFRLGQGKITEGSKALFTDICYEGTSMKAFNKLLDEGYLSPLVPKKTSYELDVDSVQIQSGEYNNKQLQAATDREEVTYRALCEMIEIGHDRHHWLIFATGVEHCEHIADMLNTFGVPAASVHSKLTKSVREQRLADFKSGKIRAAINNNVLTTGFDFPELDMIGVLRPTNSPGLWVQMLGRGTRPVYGPGFDLGTKEGRLAAIAAGPKQDCLVLDFAGNTRRLGPINDPIIPRSKGKKGGGVAPVRICPVCDTYMHASIRICTECGYDFPVNVKFGARAGTDELIAKGEPRVEVFKVDSVLYTAHNKQDRPPAIKVQYLCGLRPFSEYVCIEHGGFPAKRARDWWRKHKPDAPRDMVPESTQEAMDRVQELPEPTHIRVWVNKKYPEIMDHSFTGGFNDA